MWAWKFNEDTTESEDICNPEEEIPVQVRIFLRQTGVTNCYLGKDNNIKWQTENHRPQLLELRCTMPKYKRFMKRNRHRHWGYTYLCHTTQFTSLCSILTEFVLNLNKEQILLAICNVKCLCKIHRLYTTHEYTVQLLTSICSVLRKLSLLPVYSNQASMYCEEGVHKFSKSLRATSNF